MWACVLKMVVLFTVMVAATDAGGSTRNLKEIMIGRCWEYQTVLKPEIFQDRKKDCVDLWNKFYDAVAHKKQCGQPNSEYTAFVKAAEHSIDEERILLWSKVYPLVKEFGDLGTRYVTLDSTLAGYMADSVSWCGKPDPKSDGLDYDSCPDWQKCSDTSMGAFWRQVSKQFSMKAKGVVNVMVNGSVSPLHRANSIFSEYELPSLPKDKVSTLRILVVHNIDGPIIETCRTRGKSLSEMKKLIRKYGFNIECVDDPKAVVSFLCTDSVDSERCQHHVVRHVRCPGRNGKRRKINKNRRRSHFDFSK